MAKHAHPLRMFGVAFTASKSPADKSHFPARRVACVESLLVVSLLAYTVFALAPNAFGTVLQGGVEHQVRDLSGHLVLPRGLLGTWYVTASNARKKISPVVHRSVADFVSRFDPPPNQIQTIQGEPGAYTVTGSGSDASHRTIDLNLTNATEDSALADTGEIPEDASAAVDGSPINDVRRREIQTLNYDPETDSWTGYWEMTISAPRGVLYSWKYDVAASRSPVHSNQSVAPHAVAASLRYEPRVALVDGSNELPTDYLETLQRKVKRAWHAPLGGTGLKSEVEFEIAGSGKLLSSKLLSPSSSDVFNESIINAVRVASPFKPTFDRESHRLRYSFDYVVDTDSLFKSR